jgi:hypothetical protein
MSIDSSLATQKTLTTDARFGSKTAANFRDRHGRTCFNTGRQGTQPLCIPVINAMAAATKGKHYARSTPTTGRQLGRPPSRQWAKSCLPRCKKYRRHFALRPDAPCSQVPCGRGRLLRGSEA